MNRKILVLVALMLSVIVNAQNNFRFSYVQIKYPNNTHSEWKKIDNVFLHNVDKGVISNYSSEGTNNQYTIIDKETRLKIDEQWYKVIPVRDNSGTNLVFYLCENQLFGLMLYNPNNDILVVYSPSNTITVPTITKQGNTQNAGSTPTTNNVQNRFRIDCSLVTIYNPDTKKWSDWSEANNTFVINTNNNWDIIHYKASGNRASYRKVSDVETGKTFDGKEYQIASFLDEDGEEFLLQLIDDHSVRVIFTYKSGMRVSFAISNN